MGVAALSVLAYLTWSFHRSLHGEVRQLLGAIDAIDCGRLDAVQQQSHASGELKPVHDGLQRLAGTLSAIVADVRTSAALVEQAGQRLARDQVDLASRTEQQAPRGNRGQRGAVLSTGIQLAPARAARSVNHCA